MKYCQKRLPGSDQFNFPSLNRIPAILPPERSRNSPRFPVKASTFIFPYNSGLFGDKGTDAADVLLAVGISGNNLPIIGAARVEVIYRIAIVRKVVD